MTVLDRFGNVPDNLAQKAPCAAATVGANITLSGLFTLDGVALLENMRVLVKDQTDKTQNGIYQASSGAWARPNDANGNESFIQGTQVLVSAGTLNSFQTYCVTTAAVVDPIVVGTTEINFQGLVSLAAITNDRLAKMAARTVKANVTGTDATPDNVTVSTLFDALASVVGSIFTRLASGWQGLGPGIAGQVLTSQGDGQPLYWGPGTGTGTSITDPLVEHGHCGGI